MFSGSHEDGCNENSSRKKLRLENVINAYSKIDKLITVTALVNRFVNNYEGWPGRKDSSIECTDGLENSDGKAIFVKGCASEFEITE